MSSRFFILPLLLLAAFSGRAQTRDTLSVDSLMIKQRSPYAPMVRRGQKYLALDVMGALGGYHRYRYFPNAEIKFRYGGQKYRETLYTVTDTSLALVLEDPNTFLPETVHFRLDKVQKMYVNRQIPFVTQAAYMLPLAGVIYFLADVVNLSRGEQRLAADPRALVATSAMVGLGGICYKLSYPRYRINKNHRIKVLRTY